MEYFNFLKLLLSIFLDIDFISGLTNNELFECISKGLY